MLRRRGRTFCARVAGGISTIRSSSPRLRFPILSASAAGCGHFASVAVSPSCSPGGEASAGQLRDALLRHRLSLWNPHAGGKAAETAQAVTDGVMEVDMVLNVGAVKSGDWSLVEPGHHGCRQGGGEGRGQRSSWRPACSRTRRRYTPVKLRSGRARRLSRPPQDTPSAAPPPRRGADAQDGGTRDGGSRHPAVSVPMRTRWPCSGGANRLGCSAGIKIIEGKQE